MANFWSPCVTKYGMNIHLNDEYSSGNTDMYHNSSQCSSFYIFCYRYCFSKNLMFQAFEIITYRQIEIYAKSLLCFGIILKYWFYCQNFSQGRHALLQNVTPPAPPPSMGRIIASFFFPPDSYCKRTFHPNLAIHPSPVVRLRTKSANFSKALQKRKYTNTRSLGAPPGPNFQLEALRAS